MPGTASLRPQTGGIVGDKSKPYFYKDTQPSHFFLRHRVKSLQSGAIGESLTQAMVVKGICMLSYEQTLKLKKDLSNLPLTALITANALPVLLKTNFAIKLHLREHHERDKNHA